MKKLFIPLPSNNYTPRLLARPAILTYILLLLVFNITTSNFFVSKAYAQVDVNSLLRLHNTEREKRNLPELSLNSRLNQSAKLKADAMMDADCWDHYCPEGRSPWDFFDMAGYYYIYAGENLAEGFRDNSSVFNAWMNSKTHRENILREDFNEMGIAIVYGDFQGIKNNVLIVVHFGAKEAEQVQVGESIQDTAVSGDSTKIISITDPKDDEILNTSMPDIKGRVAREGEVIVYDSSDILGQADINEGIFTYRVLFAQSLEDGEHEIVAEHKATGEQDIVGVQIDTKAPEIYDIYLDSLETGQSAIATVAINTSSDTNFIETDLLELEFTRVADNKWVGEVGLTWLQDHEEIKIVAYDQAGNKSVIRHDLGEIKLEVIALDSDSFERTRSAFERIDVYTLKKYVNIGFIVFLVTLLLVDYYALSKIDLSKRLIRDKIQHHIAVFTLLLIVAAIGGTSGNILDGSAL